MTFRSFAVLALTALCSCTHEFSARTDANIIPNPYFSDRDFVDAGAGSTGDKIDDWCGRIAVWNGTSYVFYTKPYFISDARPQVSAAQRRYMYSSVINNEWSGAAVFPFVSADTSGNTVMEIEMIDVANVLIGGDQEPARDDVFYAAAKARGVADPKATPLFWVKGAALASLRTKHARTITGSATVSGTGFNVNGKDYASNVEASFSPLISVYVVPMNDAADAQVAQQQEARKKAREGKNVQPGPTTTGTVLPKSGKSSKVQSGLVRDPKTGLVPFKLVESP